LLVSDHVDANVRDIVDVVACDLESVHVAVYGEPLGVAGAAVVDFVPLDHQVGDGARLVHARPEHDQRLGVGGIADGVAGVGREVDRVDLVVPDRDVGSGASDENALRIQHLVVGDRDAIEDEIALAGDLDDGLGVGDAATVEDDLPVTMAPDRHHVVRRAGHVDSDLLVVDASHDPERVAGCQPVQAVLNRSPRHARRCARVGVASARRDVVGLLGAAHRCEQREEDDDRDRTHSCLQSPGHGRGGSEPPDEIHDTTDANGPGVSVQRTPTTQRSPSRFTSLQGR
jgi:hypothetical protein